MSNGMRSRLEGKICSGPIQPTIPIYVRLFAAIGWWLVTGVACVADSSDGGPEGSPFDFGSLVKSDVDAVLDLFVREELTLLEQLMRKLYLRNPRELTKSSGASIEERIDQVFGETIAPPVGLAGLRGIDALRRALAPEYQQDRVFGVIYGLATMIRNSYGGRDQFFLIDSFDPQGMYNAARNIEIAVWKLSNQRDPHGEMMILSNSLDDEYPANLSFERLFGKLIGLQDLAARVVADRSDRTIRYVIQGLAAAVFLPV